MERNPETTRGSDGESGTDRETKGGVRQINGDSRLRSPGFDGSDRRGRQWCNLPKGPGSCGVVRIGSPAALHGRQNQPLGDQQKRQRVSETHVAPWSTIGGDAHGTKEIRLVSLADKADFLRSM